MPSTSPFARHFIATWCFALFAVVAACTLTGCTTSSGTDSVATWGDPAGAHLVLNENGEVTGSDGCNRLMGSWVDEGDSVAFDNIAATRMACMDVDTWLSALATVTVHDNSLHVFDAGGTEIGTLDRAE